MTHSSVRTQTPRLPVDRKHAMEAGEFMTCDSKTQASPAWVEIASPLAVTGVKKHFCYPLRGKIVSKASHEHTWTQRKEWQAHRRVQSSMDLCRRS